LTGFDRSLRSAAGRLAATVGTVDLRDVLDQLDEPVFLDPAQVNEVGAGAIARALYDHLHLSTLAR
jgi:hypothetical protein